MAKNGQNGKKWSKIEFLRGKPPIFGVILCSRKYGKRVKKGGRPVSKTRKTPEGPLGLVKKTPKNGQKY